MQAGPTLTGGELTDTIGVEEALIGPAGTIGRGTVISPRDPVETQSPGIDTGLVEVKGTGGVPEKNLTDITEAAAKGTLALKDLHNAVGGVTKLSEYAHAGYRRK